MTDNIIHFEPDLQGTIEGARARDILWVHVLGELIDNSFDHHATRVVISINGRDLVVEDDGDGCGDMEQMLTMGRHKKSGPRLGRYGVGLKDAAWWVGGPTRIETCHGGNLHAIVLDWDRMESWSSPSLRVEKSDRRGTKIRFESMSKHRPFPVGERLRSMLDELAFIYSPAIKNGRQIVFRRGKREPDLLKRFELPTLTNVVDTTITVDGKTARVYAGIVPDGVENSRPGLAYTHLFRVLFNNALGCKGVAARHIAGWVSLDGGWTLTRNKDGISAHKAELGAAVETAIASVIAHASGRALVMRSQLLSADLTSAFRGLVDASSEAGADARAKRSKPKSLTGSITPSGNGSKHKRAKNEQAGSTFESKRKRAGKFDIGFKPLADGSIGEVDRDGGVIWLAENHPVVEKATRDEVRDTLLVIAVMLFSASEVNNETPLLAALPDGTRLKSIQVIAGRLLLETSEVVTPTLQVVV